MITPTLRISTYSDHTTFDRIWLLCFAHGETNPAFFWVYDSGITEKDHPPAADSDLDLVPANTSELSSLRDTDSKLVPSFLSLPLSAWKNGFSPKPLLRYLEVVPPPTPQARPRRRRA